MSEQKQPTGFRDLLTSLMDRRWYVTAIVLGLFILITLGIFSAILLQVPMVAAWKELLMLLLGAFIGSYGKIIDYYYSDSDKDKMLVQKMDEEDGTSLSNTADMPVTPPNNTPLIPEAFTTAISNVQSQPQVVSVVSEPNNPQKVDSPFKSETKVGVEIDEDGDGVMDGLDFDGDGKIDEYFAHRQCEHVWGDLDGDGVLECLKCGKIQDSDPDDHMEG